MINLINDSQPQGEKTTSHLNQVRTQTSNRNKMKFMNFPL